MAYVNDMTEGKEVSLLMKFALPMLLGNVFQQLYNMVDSIIVGNVVGKNALAAIGATTALSFLFFSLCSGMSIGAGILISQYFGARNEKYVKKTIVNSTYLIAFVAIIMTIVGVIFARPVLQLMNTPELILNDAVSYLQITSAGILAVAAYNAISAVLRALGDARTPLIFLGVASVLNVILDLIFVIVFGLGVDGAAYATILSQLVAALCCTLFAFKSNPYFIGLNQYKELDWNIILGCSRVGVPVAFQTSLISISCIFLQKIVNGFGENVVAAFTTVNRIEQLVQQPYTSLGAAISTFTGQNIGANRIDRVKRGFYWSIVLTAIFSALMFVCAQLFGISMVRLFVKDHEVIQFGAKALAITSAF